MKTTAFWDAMPCAMISPMMKAVRTSETSVNFYETILRIVPEGCHLKKCERFLMNCLFSFFFFLLTITSLKNETTVRSRYEIFTSYF
jgi:hypothetical protein